ncbi:MAG: hypothetical protein YYHSYBAR_001396 [Candidatus Fervidibacter sacchari]
MLVRSRKVVLKFVGLVLLLVALLWLWNAGKMWLASFRLKELTERLTSRVITVTPSPTVIVERLQSLDRLETARLVSQHVVEVKSESEWLPSFLVGERLILVAQVEVIAGVDMREISPKDIEVNGDKVFLTLPQPKIFSVKIDEAKTQVIAREKGWLVFNPDKNLEREARLQALREARAAAIKSDLLPFARQKAEENLRGFLHALGFKQVEILWRTPEMTKRGE